MSFNKFKKKPRGKHHQNKMIHYVIRCEKLEKKLPEHHDLYLSL